jgi:ribosomal-protein-alanine N-acetyltransferase
MEFIIRPWNIMDLDSLVKHVNNWNIAKNMRDKFPFPYSESNGREFIEFATKGDLIHIFAIEIEGQAVGGVGIHPQDDIHRKNAELGYWLAEPFWGKGVISRAVEKTVDFAFNNFDISRVFAKVFEKNFASQKVLEKNGFILECRFEKVLFKNNEYLDELIYAVRREKWNK